MNLGGGGCSEPRSNYCTTARATECLETPSQNMKRENDFICFSYQQSATCPDEGAEADSQERGCGDHQLGRAARAAGRAVAPQHVAPEPVPASSTLLCPRHTSSGWARPHSPQPGPQQAFEKLLSNQTEPDAFFRCPRQSFQRCRSQARACPRETFR